MTKAEMELATPKKFYTQRLGMRFAVNNTSVEVAKDPETRCPVHASRGDIWKAEMQPATSTKLYSQHSGTDFLVKNTSIEVAKDPETQRPVPASRGQSWQDEMQPASSTKLYSQHLGTDFLVKNTSVEVAKDPEPQCFVCASGGESWGAEMQFATSAELYSQHLGMDFVVRNTFLDVAREPQCPVRAGRAQSCPPPRVGSAPAEPESEEHQQSPRRGQQMRSNSAQGSCAVEEDETWASTDAVPSCSLPEMPKGSSGAEDGSWASTDAMPSCSLPEMPQEIGEEDQKFMYSADQDPLPDAGRQQVDGGRIDALPEGWRWPQQPVSAARSLTPEVVRPAQPMQAQPFDEARPTSMGSRLHAEDSCRPCYFYLVGECKRGQDCSHCHMPHDAPKWKRERPPKHVRDKMKKKEARAAAGLGGSAYAAGRENMMSGAGGHTGDHPSQPFPKAHEGCADSIWTSAVIPDFARKRPIIVSL